MSATRNLKQCTCTMKFRRTDAGYESTAEIATGFWWSSEWENQITRRTESESCRTPGTAVSLNLIIKN